MWRYYGSVAAGAFWRFVGWRRNAITFWGVATALVGAEVFTRITLKLPLLPRAVPALMAVGYAVAFVAENSERVRSLEKAAEQVRAGHATQVEIREATEGLRSTLHRGIALRATIEADGSMFHLEQWKAWVEAWKSEALAAVERASPGKSAYVDSEPLRISGANLRGQPMPVAKTDLLAYLDRFVERLREAARNLP